MFMDTWAFLRKEGNYRREYECGRCGCVFWMPAIEVPHYCPLCDLNRSIIAIAIAPIFNAKDSPILYTASSPV